MNETTALDAPAYSSNALENTRGNLKLLGVFSLVVLVALMKVEAKFLFGVPAQSL